jgi:hypothetical protein
MVQGTCGFTAIKTPETSVPGVFVFGQDNIPMPPRKAEMPAQSPKLNINLAQADRQTGQHTAAL